MRLGRRTSRRIVVVTTYRHGLRRPILVQFLLLLSSLPLTASMTDRHRHNGPSRVFLPKYLNSQDMGTGTTSLNFMTNLQDGPSWLQWSVTHSVDPNLVRLPHLPSRAALRCNLRTVTNSVGGLFCISSFKNLRIHLWIDFKQIRIQLYKNQHKKAFPHTNLKEKVLIIP